MTETKRGKKTISLEDIYKNKNFELPKEKSLETIFEEPKTSKEGEPVLTSVRKFRRALHFDSTRGKIQKRRLKAKKYLHKFKTRAGKSKKDQDISLCLNDALGRISDSDSNADQKDDLPICKESSNSEPNDIVEN